ncbi:hypothetical protein BKA69DRAFT_260770 [Paraphysoderma sedebokerense]|nr:hypothetical protein BKA69DRAFT_260770 [Paraphysoderma sedebokerense]
MLWLRQYRVEFGLMANFAFLSLFAPVLLFISFVSLLSGVRIIHYSPVSIEKMSNLPPIPDTEPLSHPMSLADEIAKFSNDLNLSLDSNASSPLPPSSPDSKALATANNASTSQMDSKLHTLGRLVHKVFEKVIPPQYLSTIDSQVHKFHQEINQTLQSLHTIVEAARKKDLNGENKDGNKQVWDSVEEQTNKLKLLEKELEKREAILTMTQQKMEELEEKLVEEMSKNQALFAIAIQHSAFVRMASEFIPLEFIHLLTHL